MKKTLQESSFFSFDCLPGHIILAGTGVLSFLWAGVQPVGFALLPVIALSALTVSLLRQPPNLTAEWRNPVFLTSALFLITWAVNLAVHDIPALGYDMFSAAISFLIILLVTSRMPRRTLKPVFIAMCLLGTLMAALHIGLIVLLKDGSGIPGFLKHGGHHYGIFAVLVAFPATGAFFSAHRGPIRLWGLTAGMLNFIYLFIDLKSIPIFLAFFGAVLFVYRSKRHAGDRAYMFIVILLAAMGLAGYHLSEWLFRDVYQSFQVENPLEYHRFPMSTAWNIAMDNPVTGIGAGNFRYFSGMYKTPGLQTSIYRAHNSFLEVLAETGATGFISMMLLLAAVLIPAFRTSNTHRMSRWIHRGFKIALILMIPAALWDFGPQLPANLLLATFAAGYLRADMLRNSRRTSRSAPDSVSAGTGPSAALRNHHRLRRLSTRYAWIIPLILLPFCIPNVIAGFLYEASRSLEKRGLLVSAAETCDAALRLKPFDDRYSAASAQVYVRLAGLTGRGIYVEKASARIDASLKRNPSQAALYYARAFILSATDNGTQSGQQEYLRKALHLDPWNHHFSNAYTQSLINGHNLAAATAELDRILPALVPDVFRSFAADFVAVWTNPADMESYLQERIGMIDPHVLLEIIRSMNDAGLEIVSGPIAIDAARNLSTDTITPVHLDYAHVLKNLNKYRETVTFIQEWIPGTADSALKARLYEAAGDAYYSLLEFHEALRMYDAAVRIQPDRTTTQLRRIPVLRNLFGTETVLLELEKLVRQFPGSVTVRLAMAREYQRNAMPLKALYEFRIANNLSGKRYTKEVAEAESELELMDIFREDWKDERRK
jgi:tetratricopeptide (TPR) repeat protein/O-antigen ligase